MGKTIILTKEQEQQIIHNYVDLRLGQKKAGAFIPVSDKIVKKVLVKNNIPIKIIQETNINKFNINHRYFQTQSADVGYWLGILSSDGCIASNENQIYIELQRGDRELLEKLNISIENERPVKDYVTGRGYENSKLYFYSKQIKADLALYNIIPNKTYSSNFIYPDKLKPDFVPDYIRGLFDGDGCIKLTSNTLTWQIDCSSKDILLHLQDFLNQREIQTKIISMPKTNISIYRLYCYGVEKCYKIYNLLYSTQSNLFLLRKKEKFKQLLQL